MTRCFITMCIFLRGRGEYFTDVAFLSSLYSAAQEKDIDALLKCTFSIQRCGTIFCHPDIIATPRPKLKDLSHPEKKNKRKNKKNIVATFGPLTPALVTPLIL